MTDYPSWETWCEQNIKVIAWGDKWILAVLAGIFIGFQVMRVIVYYL